MEGGAEFKGDFDKDQISGLGIYVDSEGNKYQSVKEGEMKQGEFLGSRLFGPGKCNYANGDEYIGKFNEGFKHGFGTMKYRTIESTEAPEAI